MALGGFANALSEIYNEGESFARVLDALASRQRNQRESKVNTLAKELAEANLGSESARKATLIDLFRRLEAIKVGRLIIGRRGKQTRFRWEYPMREVAKEAQSGRVNEAASLGIAGDFESPRSAAAPDMSHLTKQQHFKSVSHQFILRPNLTVALDLPVDLTPAEASRFAMFIRALPFETGMKGDEK